VIWCPHILDECIACLNSGANVCPVIMDNVEPLAATDLLVALKLAASGSQPASVRRLGHELGLSKSTVAMSLQKLRQMNLVKENEKGERRLNRLALRDCLEHAARWIAPGTIGDYELGFFTAHSSEGLARKLSGDDDPLVLPVPHGPHRGRAVSPMHPKAPAAAARDPKLLRLLTLVDAFRVGRARDREAASQELRACL
jgi:DNA-binding transcriptional ArsR family regulator